MLPKETINNPQALDAIFKQMHEAYEKTKAPMDKDQTRFSIAIITADEKAIDEMFEEFKKTHWEPSGFFKRCEIFPLKYEKRLLLWLFTVHAEFRIGGLILLAYYLQWWAINIYGVKFTNIWDLELYEVMQYAFPFGIFTKDTIHEFWDKQKVHAQPDNLIDYPTAAASFMPIERTEPITYKDH